MNVKAITYDAFNAHIAHKNPHTTPFLSPPLFKLLYSKDLKGISFLCFEKNHETVGVCFVGSKKLRNYLPFSTQLLNQTGLKKYDQTWIEYNNILCEKECLQECVYGLIDYLKNQNHSQLHVSMTEDSSAWRQAAKANGCAVELQHVRGFKTNLSGVNNIEDILQKLSSNSRAKVKRSLKLLSEQYGEVHIETASEKETKIKFYDDLARMHKKQWESHTEGSGFSNSYFYASHKYLLLHYPEFSQLKRVKFGNKVIGYALYYVVDKTVFFYCSGIDHNLSTGKIKPGYVMHCHLMANYAANGYEYYDFMGGESQYKKSLADDDVDFYNVTITLPTVSGRLLMFFKSMKRNVQMILGKK